MSYQDRKHPYSSKRVFMPYHEIRQNDERMKPYRMQSYQRNHDQPEYKRFKTQRHRFTFNNRQYQPVYASNRQANYITKEDLEEMLATINAAIEQVRAKYSILQDKLNELAQLAAYNNAQTAVRNDPSLK